MYNRIPFQLDNHDMKNSKINISNILSVSFYHPSSHINMCSLCIMYLFVYLLNTFQISILHEKIHFSFACLCSNFVVWFTLHITYIDGYKLQWYACLYFMRNHLKKKKSSELLGMLISMQLLSVLFIFIYSYRIDAK